MTIKLTEKLGKRAWYRSVVSNDVCGLLPRVVDHANRGTDSQS